MTDTGETDALTPIPPDVYCPSCAYDLRGAAGENCSECGYPLANLRLPVSEIPWERRNSRSRFIDFWKTVWMVTVRNRRFSEAYAQPLSYADAQKFRLTVIAHVFVPIVLATIAVYCLWPPDIREPNLDQLLEMWAAGTYQPNPPLAVRAYAAVWPAGILLISFLLFLLAVTGVPSYFFHPRQVCPERQNAGIALSYYTCAPIAFAPVVFVLGAACSLSLLPGFPWRYTVITVAIASVIPVVGAYWVNLILAVRRTMPELRGRAVLVAIAVPLLWLGLGALTFVALPLVVHAVWIVFDSLG
ncbi:MAG: hypothetical protein JSU63_15680 [Phycisphaerales bacterium]|nr:MAG: hypothetical protein JSU63_15680 [Phycisphaerales bacterium]